MEDRISHLPDHLLHYILSLLGRKYATKTGILSKRLNSVWNSFPILVLDQRCFLRCKKLSRDQKDATFVNSVDHTMQRRRENSIFTERLYICIYQSGMGLEHLDSWIDCALTNLKLTHLILVIRGNQIRNENGQEYVLPQCVWNSQWLRVLDLRGCGFSGSINPIGIGSSLRKLSLSCVRIDETSFHHVISSCFGLEDLQISGCVGFKVLNVVGLKGIHNLVLYLLGDQSVFVESPGLQFLCFEGASSNLERIIEACVLKKLKEIHMFKKDISEVDRFIGEFPWLENLYLSKCKLKESFSVSSGRLLSITLSECADVKHIVFDTCCLKQFRYRGSRRLGITWIDASDEVEIHHNFGSSDIHHRLGFSNIHHRIGFSDNHNSDLYGISFDKIAMYLANLPFCKSLTIIYDESNWMAPVAVDGLSLMNIEQLRLRIKIGNWYCGRSCLLIVKELLRMSRRPSSVLIELGNCINEPFASFMKLDFLYQHEEIEQGRQVLITNCACGGSSCWRCCLGEVQISQSLHPVIDINATKLVEFFKDNALRLKKISYVESEDDIHSQVFDCCLAPQMQIKRPPRHLVLRFR